MPNHFSGSEPRQAEPVWIALHLPRLSLETASLLAGSRLKDNDADARAVALLHQGRLTQVSPAAQAQGVQPGCRRATALALVPDLLLLPADAQRDAQALQAVAHVALAFTPSVSRWGGQTVLLEVSSCLRLFRGLSSLMRQLLSSVRAMGHALAVALAHTPLAAAWLALQAPPDDEPLEDGGVAFDPGDAAEMTPARVKAALSACPLAVLAAGPDPVPAAVLETCEALGVRTLGALRRLPREGLARRFGTQLLKQLDRAWGAEPHVLPLDALPEVFESELELLARADHSAQMLQGAQILLTRLLTWARAHQARVSGWSLRMRHERRHRADAEQPDHTVLDIQLAEPTIDLAHASLILRERLERLALPAPTLSLTLQARDLVRTPPPSGDLFQTERADASSWLRLLERLQARLGSEAVQTLVPLDEHRPERSTALQPWTGKGLRQTNANLRAGPAPILEVPLRLTRPGWLLTSPQPLGERQGAPTLAGRALQVLCGPERIEGGWWDGQSVTRDYFIARTVDGALVWIFRTRLPAESASPGWFLHGRFA
jgi:protein ImuB